MSSQSTPLTPAEVIASGLQVGLPSNGEVLCAGCWDASDPDTDAKCDIPAGDPTYYWISPMYGDGDAYCARHARERAEMYT